MGAQAEIREGSFRAANGTTLWYREAGTGDAIVLCDGLGCDGFIWKYLFPTLATTHRVIHWHYRGHGNSQASGRWDDYGIEPFSADLLELMEHLRLESAILMGHSLGVQVILQCALDCAARGEAQRVRALFPLCGAPGRPLDTFKNTSVGLRVLPWLQHVAEVYREPTQRLWRSLLPSAAIRWWASKTEINDQLMSIDDLAPYLERLSRMDPRVFLATLSAASVHDVTRELAGIAAPTLVVAAERDTFTPLERSSAMVRGLPNAEMLVLPRATHTGPLEWPELLQLRIRRFLRDHGLGADRPMDVCAPTG